MTYGRHIPDLRGEELLKRVKYIKGKSPSYDDYQIAAAIGWPLEIYRARVAVAESENLRKLQSWSLGTPLHITGDVIVVGDVHVPYTDLEYVSLVNKVAEKHLEKPRQLIIAGDYFNLDIFSNYAKLISGPGWRDEKKAAIAIAQEWAGVFDKIYFLTGNHDRRVSRRTDGEMDVRDLADFLSVSAAKMEPSLFGFATLDGNWRVTHAREYSINRLTVANELAVKYQSHIIAFHEHHLAMGWDRYNRYVIVNGGSLVRQNELAYCTLDDTKRPSFDTGFVMLKDGTPYLFGRAPFTDWARWL